MKKKKKALSVLLLLLLVLGCFSNIGYAEEPPIEQPEQQETGDGTEYATGFIDDGYSAPSYSEQQLENGIAVYEGAPPASFDLRSLSGVTPVKNQGGYATCWAMSALAAAESNLLKNGEGERDLSDLHLAYYTYNNTETDPCGGTAGDTLTATDAPIHGGNARYAACALADWRGAADEAALPYTDAGNVQNGSLVPANAYSATSSHLENAYFVSMKDSDVIKQSIMQWGACAAAYCSENGNPSSGYYNQSTHSWYHAPAEAEKADHGVTIVGWDDSYAKENFGTEAHPETPAGDGAWLVKNSWGTGFGDDGYFWLSYEDATIDDTAVFFDMADRENYDNNYQYDGGFFSGNQALTTGGSGDTGYEANVFTPDSMESLQAVSVYTDNLEVDYTVSVYTDLTSPTDPTSGTLATVNSGTLKLAGYHTIPLDTAVTVMPESSYAVVIQLTSGDGKPAYAVADLSKSDYHRTNVQVVAGTGQSFWKTTGADEWTEANHGGESVNLRIKAFTDEMPITKPVQEVTVTPSTLKLGVGDQEGLQGQVSPEDATNGVLRWTSSDEEVATVDKNGTVKALAEGTATITATTTDGSGKSATCQVTVESIQVEYKTHIQTYGTEKDWKTDGETSGTTGESKRLEAIWIQVKAPYAGGISYRTHVQTYGWQDWVSTGEMAGTTGESKRMEAIEVKLTGELANHYDIYYRVHTQTFGWMGWAKNGERAGSAGYAKRLEGIQIKLVKKDSEGNSTPPGSRLNAFHALIAYDAHVQTFGWQTAAVDGGSSGTTGLSKRLEAMHIKLANQPFDGGVTYRTHIQTYGWQGWKSNGAMTGTSGQSKRLEAIEIKLTGEMAEHYDIYYRVHAQHFGWLDWAKNGESAGTAGYSYRLETIQIMLVPKGVDAPGDTDKPFYQM